MPTCTEIMAELEALGTEQNRKVYPRHGATFPMFGVSYAHLGALRKRIGTDQTLAESLWETGNHDARVLATMIADPARCSASLLRRWAGAGSNYVLAGAVAGVAAAAPDARALAEEWMGADDEWIATCGWDTCARVAGMTEAFSPAERLRLIARIEDTIAVAKNRVRHAMNGALIAIGARGGSDAEAAIAAARRIGVVRVDHGATSCKTPDAATYIAKTVAHRAAKTPARAAAPRRPRGG